MFIQGFGEYGNIRWASALRLILRRGGRITTPPPTNIATGTTRWEPVKSAMALITEYSENITVSGFSTVAREGSHRMVTASADATHFVDCKGVVTLENCHFESMLDDATNIHGIYMRVDSVLTSTSFMAGFGHFQQEGARFADSGDTLRFIDRTTLRPIGTGKVLNIDKSSRKI